MNTVKTVEVRTFWNDLKSIKKAEVKKAKLENEGYKLISNFGGFNETVMIYTKQ